MCSETLVRHMAALLKKLVQIYIGSTPELHWSHTYTKSTLKLRRKCAYNQIIFKLCRIILKLYRSGITPNQYQNYIGAARARTL